MRFDDTLNTVLAADLSTPFGMQSVWRQLVDLLGRRRVPADRRAIEVLEQLRGRVPLAIRTASARALEHGDPPLALVRLLGTDELQVAMPVLRTARLDAAEWTALLPELSPGGRSVLRHRRDLKPEVQRALEAFGPIDFVLADHAIRLEAESVVVQLNKPEQPEEASSASTEVSEAHPVAPHVEVTVATAIVAVPAPEPEPAAEAASEHQPIEVELAPSRAVDTSAFISISQAALGIPLVAEALRFAALRDGAEDEEPSPPGSETVPQSESAEPVAVALEGAQAETMEPAGAIETSEAAAEADGPFRISDVVARIEDYVRKREEDGPFLASDQPPEPATRFRFETDAKGVLRWVEGAPRSAIVGLSLDTAALPGAAGVDGAVAGAFRRRANFDDARLLVAGASEAAGAWRISGIPVFDPATGRFTGYRGTARRPRADEQTEPMRATTSNRAADSLRQLVHELRTPTNAISGFAEMIEREMLGPVPTVYRERAGEIRYQARNLLGAIDDLDIAARIETQALALNPANVSLRPLLATIAEDLAPLCELRGAHIDLPEDDLLVTGDTRAVERLLARLLATLASAASTGERIGVRLVQEGEDVAAISVDRPRAFASFSGEAMLGLDDEGEDAALLGTGFALRLVRNLARELSGSLVIEPESLTLRLPAAFSPAMEQAHLN